MYRRRGLKYHEMNDNSNAYQIAGKLINAGIGSSRIRMWRTQVDALAHSVEVGEGGDIEILLKDL